MSDGNQHRILVVDDEPLIRQTLSIILTEDGYEVATATDGFDALLQIKASTPEVIISDLNMPQMSGFEFLSVVRRRFPRIAVIAMSGAYACGDSVPGGVIADAFYAKGGEQKPDSLLRMVGGLLATAAVRAVDPQRQSAPVWIPRNGHDSNGVPFIVLTCNECLRSFPLSVTREDLQSVQETSCLFCPNTVRYIIDFSRSVVSPKKESAAGASRAMAARDERSEL
jgi:CheY-like chemotaxis protein